MTDDIDEVDPNVSLGTLRALFDDDFPADSTGARTRDIPPSVRFKLARIAFRILDGHLSTNGHLPDEWERRELI